MERQGNQNHRSATGTISEITCPKKNFQFFVILFLTTRLTATLLAK